MAQGRFPHPKSSSPVHDQGGGIAALAAVVGGGLVGSAARTGIGLWIPTLRGAFPTGVLTVNLFGSFLIGLYLARRERAAAVGRFGVQFWAIGVLGSFTTFSAFNLDVLLLVVGGRLWTAAGYVAASIIGGLAAALIGERIGGLG